MKKFIAKILDFKKLKEENKLLRKKVKELEKYRQPLIDLKNKYLSDLRCKNLELGRLKKKIKKAKERPNDNDKWLLEKIKNFIANNCKLDSDYKDISVRDSYDFARDILKFIKMIDMDFYKLIVKKCYDDKLAEEVKLRVEKNECY